jgi:protein-tyrosine phosphatase
MIDFHAHILPGIDDGAVTIDDSISMARALADFGYKTVCCTPHCIKGYYDLSPKKVREATLLLQADLDNAGIRLELWPGMEYMLDECFATFTDNLLPLGKTRLVLCEAPPQAHPAIVNDCLKLIRKKGYVPLIAHPERTQYFFEMLKVREARGARHEEHLDFDTADRFHHSERPQKFKGFFGKFWPFASRQERPATRQFLNTNYELPDYCLFHANLGSFSGFYGQTVQSRAYALLKNGCYTALASDLHDGSSASKVLDRDKIDNNPFLKKLSEFDGSDSALQGIPETNASKEQGELF